MTPQPPGLDRRELRVERATRRKRVAETVAFGLNGLTFILSAIDGLDLANHAPMWSVATLLILGGVQVTALIACLRSKRALPERLPFALGAIGMIVSALVVRHHHSGLQYAYLFAALMNILLAWKGPQFIRSLWKRGNSLAP